MHADWQCFALVVLDEGALEQIASYKEQGDAICSGRWRLPGARKKASDRNPMQTLERGILKQIGFDLKKKSSVTLFSHSEILIGRMYHRGKMRKRMLSERYYLVKTTTADYLDRSDFELGNHQDIRWSSAHTIAEDSGYYAPNREQVCAYLETKNP